MATSDLQFDITALDRASKVFVKLAAAAEKVEKKLDDLDGKRVSPEVDVDTRKAEAKLGKFAQDARRDIEKALKALPDVDIDANATPAQQEVARLRKELVELNDQRIGIDIDAATAIGRAKAIKEQLDEIGRKSADVQVNADVAAASAALAAFSGEVDRVDGRKAKVTVDVDKSLSDSLIKVAQLGRALGALTLPAAAIAAAPQLASLGAAAVTASGALYLIPAAGAAAGLAVGTLALGFSNLGDALGDSPKKAAEAMAKLSDNAKDLVTTLKGLSPAWTDLRKSVQDALLDDAGKMVQQLAKSYLPVLKTNLVEVADGFNTAAQGVAKFLTAPAVVKDISGAMTNLRQATINASGAFEPLTRAFVDILSVGAERLPELGKGLADAATKFASFIDRARESGQLGEWIDNGIRAMQQLGSIAGNVGSALGSIFKAASSAGADFLGTVDQLTERIATFLKSGEGQSALVSLFQDIRAGVDAATPGVEALVRAVSDVVRALGDAGVLEAAGRAFSAIAAEVAPMVSSLGGLAPVLAGILNAAAGLAPVLVPIAAALGAIKLASMGTNKLSEMGTSIGILGRESKDADGKVDGLRGKVSGLAGAAKNLGASIGPAGWLSAAFAVDAATNQGLSDLLNNIAGLPDSVQRTKDAVANQGGATTWLDGIVGASPAKPGDINDVRNWPTEIPRLIQIMKANVSGAANMEPIQIPVDMTTEQAAAKYQALVAEANETEIMVEINGNTVPIGYAYNRVLEEIAAGKAEVEIDGMTLPAEAALEYIKGVAAKAEIMVPVNGEMKPLTEVLDELYGRAFPEKKLPVGADTSGVDPQMRDGVGAALGQIGEPKIPIGGDPAPFGGAVGAAQQQAAGAVGTMKLIGDPMPFNGTLVQMVQTANGQSATVTLGANGAPALLELDGVKYTVDATTGTLQLAANQDPALGTLNGTKLVFDATTGTMQLQANPAGALANLTTTVSLMDGTTGTVTLDANGAPATAVLGGTKYNIDSTTGIITIDGNPAPGEQDRSGLKVAVDRTTGTLTILGRDGGVAALKSNLSAPSSSTHTIYVRYQVTGDIPRSTPVGVSTPGRLATGGIIDPGGVRRFASGGIGRPEMYADGATRKLTPSDSSRSQIAPANSWRVFGDIPNMREYYLRDDNSDYTRSIAADWARRRGLALVPEALAGVMGQVRAAVGTPRGGAPAGGIQLGPLLGLLQQQVGQLRSLRGDVDQSLGFRELATLLQQTNSLLAAAGRSAQGSTAASRTKSDLGAW
ncbi:MAG TPA: hypothetical protein VIP28_15225 [Nocardioides sp.]